MSGVALAYSFFEKEGKFVGKDQARRLMTRLKEIAEPHCNGSLAVEEEAESLVLWDRGPGRYGNGNSKVEVVRITWQHGELRCVCNLHHRTSRKAIIPQAEALAREYVVKFDLGTF